MAQQVKSLPYKHAGHSVLSTYLSIMEAHLPLHSVALSGSKRADERPCWGALGSVERSPPLNGTAADVSEGPPSVSFGPTHTNTQHAPTHILHSDTC